MESVRSLQSLEQKGYSRTLSGRLKSVCDRSQLGVKAHHLLCHFPPAPIRGQEGIAYHNFNARLPQVVSSMLFTTNKEKAYIESIGDTDYYHLPGIAVNIATEKQIPVVRIVFGAMDTIPIRALSYILPGLLLVEQISMCSIQPPQLQIVFPHHIASLLNDHDIQHSVSQTHKFIRIAANYLAQFFPGSISSTIFLEDKQEDIHSVMELLREISGVIEAKLDEKEKRILTDKSNGNGNHLYYAAAHVLMHDTNLPLRPVLPHPKAVEPDAIISIGGQQERLFYRIRHMVKSDLGAFYNNIPTLQYFTRHHVPPYRMARDGDISFDKLSNIDSNFMRSVGKTAQYDLDFLFGISNEQGDFARFLQSQLEHYEK